MIPTLNPIAKLTNANVIAVFSQFDFRCYLGKCSMVIGSNNLGLLEIKGIIICVGVISV